MRVGLYFDLRNPGGSDWPGLYERALRTCEVGERQGAHSVWLTEHHAFDDGYLPQPLTFAAAIAARTTTIRIGTAATLAPIRDAVHLAEEAIVVDLLSAGRLDLGLGAGYLSHEYALFGKQPEKPLRQLFDKIAEVTAALESNDLTPRPVQSPIPLWAACGGPEGARRAGRRGLRLLAANRRLESAYMAGMHERGIDPLHAQMAGPVNIFLSDEPDRVAPAVERAYGYLWESYSSQAGRSGVRSRAPRSLAEARAGGLALGMRGLVIATAEQAADLVHEHYAGGIVREIFTWSMLPYVPKEVMDRHVELWCSTFRSAVEEV